MFEDTQYTLSYIHQRSRSIVCVYITLKMYVLQYDVLYLEVAKEMAEVDVKQLPSLSDHDVVRVTITDAQDVRGNTVACTGQEGLRCFLEPGE